MPSRFDREKAEGNLKAILDRLYNDTDLAVLGEYRKLYKKEISLFRRSWAAAWLFMYYDQRETPKLLNNKKHSRPEGKAGPAEELLSRENRSTVSAAALGEEESKRLFISIGKNRRLFPREIITLIMSKTSAAREDIGVIRILDNYSFVQVRDTKADEIIQTLTGIKLRGRTLAVNYAKPRGSEGESETH
jgi:hypothetical protein